MADHRSRRRVHGVFLGLLILLAGFKGFLYFGSPVTGDGLTTTRVGATAAQLVLWGLAYRTALRQPANLRVIILCALSVPVAALSAPWVGFLVLLGAYWMNRSNAAAGRSSEAPESDLDSATNAGPIGLGPGVSPAVRDGDWPQARGGPERCGAGGRGPRLPLRLAWQVPAGGYAQNEPLLWGERVYLAARAALLAVDARDGEILLERRLPALAPEHPGSDPKQERRENLWTEAALTPDGRAILAYANGENRWYCLDRETFDVRWSESSGTQANLHVHPPAVLDEVFVWPNKKRESLCCWSLQDAEALWERKLEGGVVAVSTDGERLFASGSAGIHVLRVADGELLRTVPCGRMSRPVAVAQSVLFANSRKRGLHAINADTGQVLWSRKDENRPFLTAPCVRDGVVYVARHDSLEALNAATGATLWVGDGTPKAVAKGAVYFDFSAPVATAQHVFLGGGLGRQVHGFDRRDGSHVWSWATGDYVNGNPAVAHGRLVIGSHDGHYYCFESDSESKDRD